MKNPVKFGKYYLLERISVGGMAEVFKAKSFGEAGFERLVAVKRILPSIAEDQEFIAMFVDEAKLAVQLTHPNIAQIFELGKVNETYFIALEYVPGRFTAIVQVRPKYLCNGCNTISQAAAPTRPLARSYAAAGLLAHVLTSKYADHLPLYRQSEIYAREGVELSRSTLADWVGGCSTLLSPLDLD